MGRQANALEAGPSIAMVPGGVVAARGFRADATRAGVKAGTDRLDLALVVSDVPCVAAGLFTRNQVVAAPVLLCRERLTQGRAQGIVINSGNANACTGQPGMEAAIRMGQAAAAHTRMDPSLMLVASTGVIGQTFPTDRVAEAIPRLAPSREGGHDAALAIMTTDLVSKEHAVALEIEGRRVTIGGMAKGSGMIHPNMGTMIAVVTTDAMIDRELADSALRWAVERSFNQISVDGDTSTNDTVVLLANGLAGGDSIHQGTPAAARFSAGLAAVCTELARKIARDGEGATRLVEARVEGAASDGDARQIARAVVQSSLLKAAIYGCDPNWGRILSAVGNAGIPLDPYAIDAYIGAHQVAQKGMAADFDALAVSEAMAAEEVCIRVVLTQGHGVGWAWGCDLTEGYVKINAEYTT
jgi:glutamate N-acetyltransferase/amino-acid N-acetyltransferase